MSIFKSLVYSVCLGFLLSCNAFLKSKEAKVKEETTSEDAAGPASPQTFTATADGSEITLLWTVADEDTSEGFLLLKRTDDELDVSLEPGETYETGDDLGDDQIVLYNGDLLSHTDSELEKDTTVHYQLYAYDENLFLSEPLKASATTDAEAIPKSWQGAQLIDTDGSASFPQIYVDPVGNAIAVWAKVDGVGQNIWSNRYTVGEGWGTAQIIETAGATPSSYQRIAGDSAGNAFAVWAKNDGTRNNIWCNRYVVGSGWAGAELLENNNAGGGFHTKVSVDPNGNAIVVWWQSNGSHDVIYHNTYTVGSGWSGAQVLGASVSNGGRNPYVAHYKNGNAIAVWQQHDGTRWNIYANVYTVGSGWAGEELIETNNAGPAVTPKVALGPGGKALAVWHQEDGTARNDVWQNMYTFGSGWAGAQLLETDDTGHAANPELDFDANGNIVVVWAQSDGTRNNAWQNVYLKGSGWIGAAPLEEGHDLHTVRTDVAFGPAGNAIAVWYKFPPTTSNVWASHYTPGSGWGSPVPMELEDGSARFPDIGFDAQGNAIAIWYQHDGATYLPKVNHFR